MKKILIVVGTRPEVLKIYPIILELIQRKIDFVLVSTGQQSDLLDQTFVSLNFQPDIDLGLMAKNQSPAEFLTIAQGKILEIINDYRPTIVIVQGDTTSALSGAMAGYLAKVPVGHVEAGLRSHNLLSPWPEEGFRRLIDSISTVLWFPTKDTQRPLELDQKSFVTGNTIVDTLRLISEQQIATPRVKNQILVTMHRRESFSGSLDSALKEIKELADSNDYNIIFVQHPNPNIETAINRTNFRMSKVRILNPLPYIEFIEILRNSQIVVTDSGGIQEEARTLNIPMVVLRDNSERMEAIDGINSVLSPPDGSQLRASLKKLKNLNLETELNFSTNPFGDGYSARRIVDSALNL